MADELLSQAELETLLSKATEGIAPQAAGSPHLAMPAPHTFSFRDAPRPSRPQPANFVDPQQLAMLRARHESFGRKLSAALSAWLRLVVEVRLHSVDAHSLGEMLDAADEPMFCQLLRAAPLEQRCIVDLPLDVLYIILDRLLGGGREPAVVVRRPPTEIELRLASRITGLILAELKTAWQGMLDLELMADRVETDRRWPLDAARAEPMLDFSFEIKLSDARGTLRLAIPLAALRLVGQTSVATRADAVEVPRCAAQTVNTDAAPVGQAARTHGAAELATDRAIELAVGLAETTITARDLQQLQAGDIIATEQPADGLVDVYQDGVLTFQAQLGSFQGQKAIEIRRVVEGSAADPSPP